MRPGKCSGCPLLIYRVLHCCSDLGKRDLTADFPAYSPAFAGNRHCRPAIVGCLPFHVATGRSTPTVALIAPGLIARILGRLRHGPREEEFGVKFREPHHDRAAQFLYVHPA